MPAETVLEASREGDWARLLELLPNAPKGAEERDDWARLPLHYAALQPNTPLDVFQKLLAAYPEAAKAPIGWDEMEQTPLDYATEKNASEKVLAVLREAAKEQPGRLTVTMSDLGARESLMEAEEEEEFGGDSSRAPADEGGDSPLKAKLMTPDGKLRSQSTPSRIARQPSGDPLSDLRDEFQARQRGRPGRPGPSHGLSRRVPRRAQVLKDEMTETAMYIVDEVEARLKSELNDEERKAWYSGGYVHEDALQNRRRQEYLAQRPLPPVSIEGFVPAPTFDGVREGMVFKMDDAGLGYYKDQPINQRLDT